MSPPAAPVQAILELFQGPLATLRFADVDASALSNLADAAEAAAADVALHEAQLAELRQILADRQEALLVLAQRALAYARVYAEHDEALSEQLARINLPRPGKPRKASSKPASAAADSLTAAEATASAEGAEPAETSEVVATAALEEPAAEEPTLEVARSPKGKRRSNASRDEAQSSEAT